MNQILRSNPSQAKNWKEEMAFVVEMMREMSSQTDPQKMGSAYRERIRQIIPVDGSLSLSRRDLEAPEFRVTRSSQWSEEINPWKEKDRLPLLSGGVLADLLYGDEPHLFDAFDVSANDPGFEYLDGFRSIAAIPMYDRGVALNMVLLMRKEPEAFSRDEFPQQVWMSNLYGRATHNLVLSEQLLEAYAAVDHELKAVAGIQRSLLPTHTPKIPTLSLAASYQTSQRAGGDYYDFFPQSDGRWGMLIADVSGHGTPAAVIMAVMHSLAHTYPGPQERPGQLLEYLNRNLHAMYTRHSDAFVTAFYAFYDPRSRLITYSSAGHNPPRLKRCADGSLALLDQSRSLPLGIGPDETFADASIALKAGDQLILYTDGITEAHNKAGEMFGMGRLDRVLHNCAIQAPDLLRSILDELDLFTAGQPAHDDRTLLVLKVS